MSKNLSTGTLNNKQTNEQTTNKDYFMMMLHGGRMRVHDNMMVLLSVVFIYGSNANYHSILNRHHNIINYHHNIMKNDISSKYNEIYVSP